jgi:hypothetical protein
MGEELGQSLSGKLRAVYVATSMIRQFILFSSRTSRRDSDLPAGGVSEKRQCPRAEKSTFRIDAMAIMG